MFKILISALMALALSGSFAVAQDAPTSKEAVVAACSAQGATPASCKAAVEAFLTSLKGTVSAQELNKIVAAVAVALTSSGASASVVAAGLSSAAAFTGDKTQAAKIVALANQIETTGVVTPITVADAEPSPG